MVSKFLILSAFLAVNISLGSDRKLTGNFQWDVLSLKQDSIVENSILLEPAKHQDPFANGLYSLVLPGAGQYRSERYLKGAIFLGAEIALVVYAVISNNNGDKKTDEFQRYAEANWNAVRYARWIGTHGVVDYGPTVAFTQSDYDAVANHDYTKINAWESGQLGNHTQGFSHQLPKFGEQQYYELIGKYHQFKYGWNTYPQDANGVPVSDGGRYDDMIPQQLKEYAKERGKANDYYYAASFAVSVLVINHVASAIDAFISTRSYNTEITASLDLKPVDGIEGTRLLSEFSLHVGF